MPRTARSPQSRGPYAKSAQVKADIVQKATEAFTDRGFSSTSLREIAAAVGMTQQGISHHFSSKEALLAAVLERHDEEQVLHFGSAGLSAVDTLRAVLRANTSKPGLMRLSVMLAAESINDSHPAHSFFRSHYTRSRSVFTALAKRGQEEGDFRTDMTPKDIAAVVVSCFEGMQMQWLIDPKAKMEPVLENTLLMLRPARASRG